MDTEFHYYINYIIALRAGFAPEIAYKIAYSAQYVDDNTESYTILQKVNLDIYSNIITQSINPTLSVKDMISIYPVFHFIPGDDIIRSSSLRRDGECRYMTTTPNNKLARNTLINALKSSNPYWIGIASHGFVDTWAHQNFTGLKDKYNCVDKHQTNKTLLGKNVLGLSAYVGHADVLHLPDTPNTIWYDYRLKDMKIDNNERFLDAAKNIFEMYLKYADKSLLINIPSNPESAWNELESAIKAIFVSDLEFLQSFLGKYYEIKSKSTHLIMQILGINKSYRIEFYKQLAKKIEAELGITNSEFDKYDKNKWLNKALYETLDTIQSYDTTANDNNIQYEAKCAFSLSDSANQEYYSGFDIGDQIKRKISSLLGVYKKLYMWRNNHKYNDWYHFQEAAKTHHSYIIDKVIRIMRKDIKMMQQTNINL
jgi:hypothetical protein